MIKSLIVICLIFIATSAARGQQEDFSLWASLDLETHLNKRFDLVVELSDRFHENATRRDVTFMEAGLEYSKKWLSAGIAYRFENKTGEDAGYVLGHKFIGFVSAEAESGRFTFSLRNKFQAEYVAVKSSENGPLPVSYDRTRGKVDYNIRKSPLKPYVFYEVFSRVNADKRNMIARTRIGTGMTCKINSKNKFGLDFYYDHEANVPRPNTDYILSAVYVLELN